MSQLGVRSRSSSTRKTARKSGILQTLRAAFDGDIPSHIQRAIDVEFSGNSAVPDHEGPPEKDPPPSDFARRKVWKTYQFQDPPRFLAYRGPLTARPPISLVLVHESFSDLACDLENEALDLSEEDFEMAEGVYALFTEGFDDEVRQMNGGKLSDLFAQYLDAGVVRQVEHAKMDGCMILSARPQFHPVFIFFEDKTDDGPNGYMEGLEICRKVFLSLSHYSHGIFVLRACPYIIFIAIVMDRKANVLLSEPLAHIPFWGPEYRTVLQGAKAMRALRNFSDRYVPQRDIDVSRPWPIAAWQNVNPLSKDGLVLYGTFQSKARVAKFTQLYSREAHEAWHSEGLAPELYDSRDLGAGWKFVTVEYLSADEGWQSVKDLPAADDTLQERLIEFLNKAHKTGYVHGDFRPPNILIHSNGEIQAIDFEWSGLQNEARYPVQPNPEIQWEPTARRGQVLKESHDVWHVKKIGVDPAPSTSRVA